MIGYVRNAWKIAWEISDAANRVINAYRDGRVVQEPQITDRILGAIEDRINQKYFVYDQIRPSSDTTATQFELFDDHKGKYRRRVLRDEEEFPRRIVWKSRSLRTSSGIGAEEKRHGADLMGLLDIDVPDYRVIKGFLSQAKRAEPNQVFSKSNWDKLHSQCEIMLSRTPVSFVWVSLLQNWRVDDQRP